MARPSKPTLAAGFMRWCCRGCGGRESCWAQCAVFGFTARVDWQPWSLSAISIGGVVAGDVATRIRAPCFRTAGARIGETRPSGLSVGAGGVVVALSLIEFGPQLFESRDQRVRCFRVSAGRFGGLGFGPFRGILDGCTRLGPTGSGTCPELWTLVLGTVRTTSPQSGCWSIGGSESALETVAATAYTRWVGTANGEVLRQYARVPHDGSANPFLVGRTARPNLDLGGCANHRYSVLRGGTLQFYLGSPGIWCGCSGGIRAHSVKSRWVLAAGVLGEFRRYWGSCAVWRFVRSRCFRCFGQFGGVVVALSLIEFGLWCSWADWVSSRWAVGLAAWWLDSRHGCCARGVQGSVLWLPGCEVRGLLHSRDLWAKVRRREGCGAQGLCYSWLCCWWGGSQRVGVWHFGSHGVEMAPWHRSCGMQGLPAVCLLPT